MANFRGVLVRCTDGLKHVDVPEGVEEIGFMAFAESKSLESAYIPASVKRIDSCVFGWCPSLVSITVSPDNRHYDSRDNCNAVIETAVILLQEHQVLQRSYPSHF